MDIQDCIDYVSNIANVDEARQELTQINSIISECENALNDYVDRLEKQGAIMGYGNWVLNMCRTYLVLHPQKIQEAATFVTYCADCGGAEYHSITCIHRGF